MNIVIRADRKIGKNVIATHIFSGRRIIDNFIDFLNDIGAKPIIVTKKDLGIKNVGTIGEKDIPSLRNPIILDLKYVYDERKLKKILQQKKDVKKAIIKENKVIADLNSFGCLFQRKEWNPIGKYYIEPLAEKLAFWLKDKSITPNQITFINIALGLLATSLIYLNTSLSLVIFGIWVRIYHVLDAIDGHLARLTNKLSLFGKWLDGGGDKLVMVMWYAAISLALFLVTGKNIYIFGGFLLLIGMFLYNYLLLTSVAYFRNYNKDYTVKKEKGRNLLVEAVLLFINYDIQLHFLTICAIIGKIQYFLFFYAVYFNFIWIIYFLYYFTKYIKKGHVKEC